MESINRNIPNYSLQKLSTRDYAYSEIKQRIITGDLPPNKPIVEEGLALDLEISRTPLREALQRLEIEELVVRQMNGRLKVAPISIQEVEEIFTIRSMLEEIVVSQATEKVTDRDLGNLANIVLMIEQTFNTGNIEDVLYYGSQFHTMIYEISDNKTAIKILYQLNDHIHRYQRLIPIRNIDRLKKSVSEHKRILEKISLRDKAGAVTAMKEHIKSSLGSAIKSIEIDVEDN